MRMEMCVDLAHEGREGGMKSCPDENEYHENDSSQMDRIGVLVHHSSSGALSYAHYRIIPVPPVIPGECKPLGGVSRGQNLDPLSLVCARRVPGYHGMVCTARLVPYPVDFVISEPNRLDT